MYVVDIPGGNLSEGTSVEIYQQTDGGNQQLVIAREEYTRPSGPAAPANVQLITGEDRTAVMWKEVPATSAYDSRQYDVIVYDSNSNVVFRGSTADTAFVSNQVLQPGHYEIYVRSVNTKYPSSASNYASGYTNVSADVVLTYSVSLGTTEGGIVRGAGFFQAGTSVTVTATLQNGCRFVEWTENDVKVNEDASYTFQITKSRDLTAVFEEETSPVPTTYTVSVSTEEGGSVTGGGNYEDGSSVTVIATPDEGYVFKEWTEKGSTVSGASASYTVTVNENRQLVAVFEKVETPPAPPEKYTISVSASPTAGGSVSGGSSYQGGASVTVTATANTGYRFTGWTESGSQVSTSNSYTFAASANRALVAGFTYTSSSSGNSSGGNHSGSSSGSTTTTSIPVSTGGTNSGGMVTTAVPNATTKDNVATSVITTTISNEIIKQAVVNKSSEVVISPIIKDTTAKAEITIPADTLRDIERKTDASLVVSTPIADVRLPNISLSKLFAKQPISIVTEKAGDVLALSITAGGSSVKVQDGVILAAPLAHSAPVRWWHCAG